MYAIIDYKGSQLLLKEGTKVRIPFLKDSKVGSTITLDNVLFYDDGKKKHTGNPFIKNMNFKAKVISHEKDSKVLVFKQKRRKGYQKKNGYRDNFTLIQLDKLSPSKTKIAVKKATTTTKKSTAKKSVKSVKVKKNTAKSTKK